MNERSSCSSEHLAPIYLNARFASVADALPSMETDTTSYLNGPIAALPRKQQVQDQRTLRSGAKLSGIAAMFNVYATLWKDLEQ
eukprot:1009761-Amphidinium_carterae.1